MKPPSLTAIVLNLPLGRPPRPTRARHRRDLGASLKRITPARRHHSQGPLCYMVTRTIRMRGANGPRRPKVETRSTPDLCSAPRTPNEHTVRHITASQRRPYHDQAPSGWIRNHTVRSGFRLAGKRIITAVKRVVWTNPLMLAEANTGQWQT